MRQHYIYRITNTVNGKIYVGARRSADPKADDYMGSGKLIRAAVAKYGAGAFTKEVLATFESAQEMFQAERDLVTLEFVARKDTYNIKVGGHGGFDHVNAKGLNCQVGFQRGRQMPMVPSFKEAIRRMKERGTYDAWRRKAVATLRRHGSWVGRKHKAATKLKMSEKAKSYTAHRNGMFRLRWYTDGTSERPVAPSETEALESAGWRPGRKPGARPPVWPTPD